MTKVRGVVAIRIMLVQVVAVLKVLAFVAVEAVVVRAVVSRVVGEVSITSRSGIRTHGAQWLVGSIDRMEFFLAG